MLKRCGSYASVDFKKMEGMSDLERLAYYRAQNEAQKAECRRIREKIGRGEPTTEAEDVLMAFMPAPDGYASSHGY